MGTLRGREIDAASGAVMVGLVPRLSGSGCKHRQNLFAVMPGPGPGIHDFPGSRKDVDGRNKSGHDDWKYRLSSQENSEPDGRGTSLAIHVFDIAVKRPEWWKPWCACVATFVALLAILWLFAAPAIAEPIRLETGAGQVINLAAPAANIFVADPKIAEVRPASPTALFVFGLAPGRTTVAALDSAGRVLAQDQITVQPSGFDANQAEATLARLMPASRVRVAETGKALLLTGAVATPAEAARAVTIARGFANPGEGVVNQLTVATPAQVTLEVRIVEMSRSIMRSLGINWTALGTLGSIGKLPALNGVLNGGAPVVCAAGTLLSIACQGLNINALIDALSTDGLVHVLAEPNLTVLSGEPASFLAGGEFPIPVGQQNGQITIEFKQFGVQLAFVPTVLDGGRINLKVAPEVSQLSQQGAVQLTAGNSSISVPALTVRRAETTVELGSGESFAIAGLLLDSSTLTSSGLPALRKLPVLGKLFRSDSFQRNETELVILVTPILARPVDDPAALHVPGDTAPVAELIPLPRHGLPGAVPAAAGFIVQ